MPMVSRYHPDMGRHLSSLVAPPTTPGLLSIHSLDDASSGDTYFDFGAPTTVRDSLVVDVYDVIDEDLRIGLRECHIDSDRLVVMEAIGQGEHCRT